MKRLSKQLLAIMLCLVTSSGFAQTAKQVPTFANLPTIINCSVTEFEAIFDAKPGSFVKISINNNLYFGGKIVYNEVKYYNLQTVAIQSSHFGDAVFSLSKQINADKSISYVGRILKKGSTDGYELNRGEKGNYTLNKIETTDIMPVCL